MVSLAVISHVQLNSGGSNIGFASARVQYEHASKSTGDIHVNKRIKALYAPYMYKSHLTFCSFLLSTKFIFFLSCVSHTDDMQLVLVGCVVFRSQIPCV